MHSDGDVPKLLTVAEVADTLRVSTMTVYRMIKAGDLAAVRVGKSYRIRANALETFLTQSETIAEGSAEQH